jgi:hypothetical protein
VGARRHQQAMCDVVVERAVSDALIVRFVHRKVFKPEDAEIPESEGTQILTMFRTYRSETGAFLSLSDNVEDKDDGK